MNAESAIATVIVRTQGVPAQRYSPTFLTENLNALFTIAEAVNEKGIKWEQEIKHILRDRSLSDEGKQQALATLAPKLIKDMGPPLAQRVRDTKAAISRLMHKMLDPITAKPKDADPMMTFLREQELRRTIPKDEAHTAFLRALETDDLETARALLDAPGAAWISKDVRRRGEEAYAQRTDPTGWATAQSLITLKDHLLSLSAQLRQLFLALGASADDIERVLGD